MKKLRTIWIQGIVFSLFPALCAWLGQSDILGQLQEKQYIGAQIPVALVKECFALLGVVLTFLLLTCPLIVAQLNERKYHLQRDRLIKNNKELEDNGDSLENKEENNEKTNTQKRKIENLVFLIVILIITIVAINLIWNDEKSDKQDVIDDGKILANQDNTISTNNIQSETTSNLETNLENILSRIQGVGEVHVFVNYSESSEVVAMYNENSQTSTTEETDTSGGVRKIQETDSQKEIIYQENDGEKVPITQKVIEPKIEGAIITAKGASDANVKTNIIQAVEAVTGLATHKIQVFELN